MESLEPARLFTYQEAAYPPLPDLQFTVDLFVSKMLAGLFVHPSLRLPEQAIPSLIQPPL